MATKTVDAITGSDGASPTKRRSGVATVAVHTSLGSCDVIDISQYSTIAIKPPASVTAVDVYGCESAGGTFVLVDNVGTAGQVAVTASKWNVLPAGVGALPFIKLLATGATGNCVVVGKT